MTRNIKQEKIILHNNEIKKIKDEEVLRYRIKKELEGSSDKNEILTFFNSPLGLFILSLLFISGLGNYLSRNYEETKEKQITQVEVNKHLVELEYRLTQIDYYLERMRYSVDSTDKSYNGIRIWRIITGDVEYKATLKEYNGISLIGIVSYLKFYSKDRILYNNVYKKAMGMQLMKSRKNENYLYDEVKLKQSISEMALLIEKIKNEQG